MSESSFKSCEALVLSLTVLCLATKTKLLAVQGVDMGRITCALSNWSTAFLANSNFSPPINLFFCCLGTSFTCKWCVTNFVRPMS